MGVPVVEGDEVLGLDSEQATTKYTLNLESNLEDLELLHVLINLDLVIIASDRKRVGVRVVS